MPNSPPLSAGFHLPNVIPLVTSDSSLAEIGYPGQTYGILALLVSVSSFRTTSTITTSVGCQPL
jgi:hypothetical protein